MATAKRRKVPGINPFPNAPPNLISSFEKASELKKRREKRRIGIPDRLYNLIVGDRGEGKSYTSLLLAEQMKKEVEKKLYEESKEPEVAVITDDEMKALSKPARKYFAAAGEFAYGAAGGGGGSGDFVPKQQEPYQYDQNPNPWSSHPQQTSEIWNQRSWTYPHSGYPPWMNDDTPEKTATRKKKKEELEEAKKQEYSAEDFKGRFCAVVTMELKPFPVYTGVIFVKKCGHWKLMDFNGNKLSGGKAGSFEELLRSGKMLIEIHKTLYDAEPPKMDNMDLEIV